MGPSIDKIGLSQEALSSVQQNFPDEDQIAELAETVRKAQRRLEQTQNQAELYIDIGEPWSYDPSDYSPDNDALYTSMKWTYEGRKSLESTGDDDLEILANRIEEGHEALARELSNSDKNPYKGLHLLISSLDGLIIYLCENDKNESPTYNPSPDDPVYNSSQKRNVLEKSYDSQTTFKAEDGDGTVFKEKWKAYWHHRHRIMHGSPHAYYDRNVSVATLFFVGITAHLVAKKHSQLQP